MSNRFKIWLIFGVTVTVTVFMLWLDMPGGPNIDLNKIGIKPAEGKTADSLIKKLDIKLGLDLKGGAELVYRADLSGVEPAQYGDAMSGVRDVIERRVNAFGVSEPNVYVQGQDKLTIELPGVTDLKAAVDAIGKTPTLVFMEESTDASQVPSFTDENGNPIQSDVKDKDGNPIDLSKYMQSSFKATNLTGKDLTKATVVFDQSGVGAPQISLEFSAEGKVKFEEITGRNVGKRVAIVLDGATISAPTVNEKIIGGNAVITGDFTVKEAKELVRNLNAGALPVPISLVQEQTIGATLGKLSVEKSLVAGFVGIIVVIIYMIVFYRLPGVLAVVALTSYIALSLFIFKMIPVTLTLSGIAGFILSIGMAVDANVLIFERMKEELRSGKDFMYSVDLGFKGAWPSIRDGNFTTLISCAVLYVLGTSIIKGFALTLGIGVLSSLLSAIVVTRIYLKIISRVKSSKLLWWFGVSKKDVTNMEKA